MSENDEENKINKNISYPKIRDNENSNFLKRWSNLKSKKLEDNDAALENEENNKEESLSENIEEDEESKMSNEDLFEKYEVADPDTINTQVDLREYIGKKIPDRIKQLALRRLWKIVPLYGEVSELVEYGEDFTDAATVFEGMQTAYVIGKGYADKVIEKTDKILDLENEVKTKNEDGLSGNKKEIKGEEKTEIDLKNKNLNKNDDVDISIKKEVETSETSDSLNETNRIESKPVRPSKMVFVKN